MKKRNLLIGILIGLTIFACSTDDDNETQDTIIGIWKPLRYGAVYTEAGEVAYEYSTCSLQNRITFSSNGSFDLLVFDENNNGDCLEDDSNNFISGTWEKISQNQYDIRITFFNENTQQNEIHEVEDEIIFANENTMRFVRDQNEEFNGDFLEYEFDEYTRVE